MKNFPWNVVREALEKGLAGDRSAEAARIRESLAWLPKESKDGIAREISNLVEHAPSCAAYRREQEEKIASLEAALRSREKEG